MGEAGILASLVAAVAHRPVPVLEVVGKYELVGGQHRLYEEQVPGQHMLVCLLVVCKLELV